MNIAHIKRCLAIALLATTLCSCALFAAPVPQGKNSMTELTKTMKPVCVGRLVIEIPEVAYIKGWDQEVNYTKIESVTPPSQNRKSFDAKLNQREKMLMAPSPDNDGALLKSKTQLSPDSILFAYRKSKRVNRLDALYWRPGLEYLFHKDASNEYLKEDIQVITDVTKSFIATPTTDLATLPPGLCIEHGVITGADNEYRKEHVAVSGRIDAYPGLTFSFSTESASQPSDDLTMIQRIDRSLGMGDAMGKEVSAATRFIRKGKRKLNGQDGEEMVLVATINGITHMEAKAEFYAEPKVLDKPIIEVSLSDQTHDNNTHQPFNKNLTEKEFLAMWDAMLNGIKPRPKNAWGVDSK